MTTHMRTAITGASGFVGQALVDELRRAGHDVVRLVREAEASGDAISWDPPSGRVDLEALGAIDAVVHLAGVNIAGRRWTPAYKRAIADSRIGPTEALCRTLAAMPQPPRVLVSASAIGIHGDRGEEVLDETSAPGNDFLADVCKRWEAATAPAAAAGIRVVNLRTGLVLDGAGGALPKLARPFRFGVGGRLGDGRQWTSWITRHDHVRAIRFALEHGELHGPVLSTSPSPVTNRELTRVLARTLRRPALFAVPRFALRIAVGELADALLASQRCQPRRLVGAGFVFDHSELEPALRAVLAR